MVNPNRPKQPRERDVEANPGRRSSGEEQQRGARERGREKDRDDRRSGRSH